VISVFIGYDSKVKIAYHVLAESILKHSSEPVSIHPIYLPNIQKIHNKKQNILASTEFSFSRFLVPYLMNYQGWAVFMDSDMVMISDITELWQLKDEKYALQVCKHEYTPNVEKKFLNNTQTIYAKKNWSSLMLMNCSQCKTLTTDYVNTATGLELHQFKWLKDESLIGEIPLEWNWLVGEYPYNTNVKNIHFTEGGPYFEEYKNCQYSKEWYKIYNEMIKINLI
jgi:lipopolysaccharide biosynthesis glycosyltransferase